METVRYLTPAPESHGHWIVGEDEKPRLTRSVMKKAELPPDEAQWLAIEQETVDALMKRRRIRQKSTIRSFQKDEGVDCERQKIQRGVEKLIAEEMPRMVDDHPDLVAQEMKILQTLKKMAEVKEEEEEVLQTRVISPKEVARDWEQWLPAVREEVNSLLTEKEAIQEISKTEVEALIREAHASGKKVEILPSKLVCTVKPGPNGGRRKVRWVICGNFEEQKAEDTFSSGADAAAFRILVTAASFFQWVGGTIDVKTAFLNADMKMSSPDEVLLIRPPPITLEKKYFTPGTCYLPLKSVYGLRRSPRLWGDCRDEFLVEVEVKLEGEGTVLHLSQLESEPNLWRIEEPPKEEGVTSPLRGLLMTYVDDIFVAAEEEVSAAVIEAIRQKWKTSEPDVVGEKPIRFLGMEVTKVKNQETGREEWYVTQESFIKDLLQKDPEEIKKRKIPITRDQSLMPAELEENRTPEGIREAQKAVGEMLWLVTRSRPDLMFSTARIGANATKHPSQVMAIYQQLKGYLKATEDEGLVFSTDGQGPIMIEALADASFSPDGEESHGAFLIQVGGCPIFWRSGRQQLVALSTAEAEMMEIVQGMLAGESIAVIAEEVFPEVIRRVWSDSQAAISILTNEGGNWRTRHLRMRAAAARQSISRGDWALQHQMGESMIADVGTKALASPRLAKFKREMGMRKRPRVEDPELVRVEEGSAEKGLAQALPRERLHEGVQPEGAGDTSCDQGSGVKGKVSVELADTEKVRRAIQIITLAAIASGAKGQDEEEEENFQEFHQLMVIFALLVVLITILCQQLWKIGFGPNGGRMQTATPVESSATKSNESSSAAKTLEGREKKSSATNTDRSSEVRTPVAVASGASSSQDPITPDVHGRVSSAGGELVSTLPCEPTLRCDMSQRDPSGGGEESSESESSSTEDSLADRIVSEIHQIEREEGELWREIRGRADLSRSALPEGTDPSFQLPFRIFTTRYGVVCHASMNCNYVRAPQTGPIRESEWCHLCREVAEKTRGRPPPGVEIMLAGWGGPAHTSDQCPFSTGSSVFKMCTMCDRLLREGRAV